MRRITPVALLALGCLAAQAVEYKQIVSEKSALAFVYKQMNVPMEGSFKRFKSQIAFDPAKPAAASAQFEIDLASIDTGSAEGDEEVAGKLWFNTKAFPTAKFVSSAIKPLGNNRFEVAGALTIKGRTQNVVAPATYKAEGAQGVFEGALTIRRADFGIGEGVWADFGTVANDVQIKFRLLAAAGK
ncbi:MAG: YceI family protein [Rhodocyclaceae bacterium]